MMECTDLFNIDATLVANEFLDKYMPKANGDYVKVYLFLLKHRVSGIDIETIAEHLELTEGDVRRALKYWEKQGILSIGGSGAAAIEEETAAAETSRAVKAQNTATQATTDTDKLAAQELRNHYKKAEGREAIERLSGDEEYKSLLIEVQTLLSKILSEGEEQVLAYLYDGLHMPADLIAYLVEYCKDTGHENIRYIEKTGLDWVTHNIQTVAAAKARTREFDKMRDKAKGRAVKKAAGQTIFRTGAEQIDYDAELLNHINETRFK